MSVLPIVLPDWVTALIVAIGWALLFFLGQGLFIGLVVAAMLRGLQGRSADVRYAAACLGLFDHDVLSGSNDGLGSVVGPEWGRNGGS